MTEQISYIPARLKNAAVNGHVAGAEDIIDDVLNRTQNDINEEVAAVPYNVSSPNGMGKVVLKKNDNFKQVVEAQTNGNTIFVIKYDFTLSGNVTVPANCVLEFDGGSISGAHTITGQNTGIKAGLVKIFNTDVTLAESWNIAETYTEWFGAKADNVSNSTVAIQKAINLASLAAATLHFNSGVYLIYGDNHEKGLVPKKNVRYVGHNTTLKMMTKRCNIFSNAVWYFEDGGYQEGMSDIENVLFDNITFDGNASVLGDPYYEGEPYGGDNFSYGIYIMKGKNITINNCIFKNFIYGGHNLWGCEKQKIIDSYFTAIGIYNAHFGDYTAMGSDGNRFYPSGDVYYGNNILENCGGGLRANAGGNWGTTEENVNFTIENNTFRNSGGIEIFMGNYSKIIISNNYFFNGKGFIIEPMIVGDAVQKVEGVVVENNVWDTDGTVQCPSTFFVINSIPMFVFKNNTINYKATSEGITFFNFSVTENYDVTHYDTNRSIIIENNVLSIPDQTTVFNIPDNTNLYLKNNTIKIIYIASKLINLIANNNCNVFISNNDFTGTDIYDKEFSNAPLHCTVEDNIGYVTKLINTYNLGDGDYQDLSIVANKVFIQPEGDGLILNYTISANRRRLIFKVRNIDGTEHIGLIPIHCTIIGKYYNYTRE